MAATMYKCATCGIMAFTREGFMAHSCSRPKESSSTGKADQDTSSTLWTNSKSKLLLNLYKERVSSFNSPLIRNKGIWENIREIINQNTDSSFTTAQVEGRYKTIVAAYRKFKDNVKKTGASRKDFEFKGEMDDIMGDSHDTSPKFTFSSAEGATGTSTCQEPDVPGKTVTTATDVSSDSEDSESTCLKRKKKENKKQSKKTRTSGATQMIEFLGRFTERLDRKDEEAKKRADDAQKKADERHNEQMKMMQGLTAVLNSLAASKSKE